MTHWAFITDAGPSIGHGHAARIAILARAAASRGDSVSVFLPVETSVPTQLDGARVPIKHTAFTADSLGTQLDALQADHVVVLLDVPDDQLEQLSWLRNTRFFCAAFRFFGPPDSGATEHVSLTPVFEPSQTHEFPRSNRPVLSVTGSDLILVRPSLFPTDELSVEQRKGIVVTMGGADPFQLTELACEDLAESTLAAETTVVLGSSNERQSAIATRFRARLNIVMQDDVDFDNLVRGSAAAVINGGLTRYECIAASTPFVAISIHAKQYGITQKTTQYGFGINLGVYTDIGPGHVNSAVERLFHQSTRSDQSATTSGIGIRPDAPVRLLERLSMWERNLLS